MSSRTAICATVLFVFVGLHAPTSAAQTAFDDRSLAEALFLEGVRLMDAGRFPDACPKLAASLGLDRGLGTLLHLGDCYDRNGQSASAWTAFREAHSEAKAAGQRERAEIARLRVQALEPRLTRLTIVVPESMHEVAGLRVRLDGRAIASEVWGVPVPLDPGSHRIEADAPGRRPWATAAEVDADEPTSVVTMPALEPDAGAPAAPAMSEHRSVVRVRAAHAPSNGSATRNAALASGGLGVAALATGSILGLAARAEYEDARTHCRTATLCNSQGVAGVREAERVATASTALFVAGAGAVALGVVLWLVSPGSDDAPRRAARDALRAEVTW